jgi:hypothetical protein
MVMNRSCPENATRFHLKVCSEIDFTRKKKDRKTKKDMASDDRKRNERTGMDKGTDPTVVPKQTAVESSGDSVMYKLARRGLSKEYHCYG